MARRAREPQRTCVVCRRVRGKGDLVRIVLSHGGTVVVDRTGHAEGRGAYVCLEQACIERARRRLAGALRTSNIDFGNIDFGNVDFTEISRELTVV